MSKSKEYNEQMKQERMETLDQMYQTRSSYEKTLDEAHAEIKAGTEEWTKAKILFGNMLNE